MEKYKIVLIGELRYYSHLQLDNCSLDGMIIEHLPPVPIEEEEHDFGKVKVTIEFMECDVCQTCGSVLKGEK